MYLSKFVAHQKELKSHQLCQSLFPTLFYLYLKILKKNSLHNVIHEFSAHH